LRLCAVPFSLRELCEGVVQLLGPQVAGKPVQVEFVWAAQSERECVGDAGRVRQVLVNLLGNAVKFTGRGKVELRVMDVGQEMFRVEVSDTGIGIPLEVQPRIFGKFVQADSSSTRQYGGSGLGLAISRQLVEAMGGQIGFRSQPGEGSCFWFEIPVQMKGEAGSAPEVLLKEAKGQIPPGLPVLVAEDNPVNQRLAQRMLENLGCKVQLAANGLEAISLVAEGEFKMIFMDCQMPGMDGFEAAQVIRAMKPEQVIVALTANALPTDRQRCLAAGMQDYLAKPVRQQELREMLLRWVGS
jgi:CheY-like chemotaxis protein